MTFSNANKYRLTDFWRRISQDLFKRYLVISLIILGVILLFTSQKTVKPINSQGLEIHFFSLSDCPHCEQQKSFYEKLVKAYPSTRLIYHDAVDPKEQVLLSEMLTNLRAKNEQLEFPPVTVFPVTIFGERVFFGWEPEETRNRKIEEALQQYLAGNYYEANGQKPWDVITLPIVGKIKPADYSLPTLAIVLGLVDGFNPCAMWALVYLISLVMTLKDRSKVWLLVGSFVFASGVLYFLFMTVWLNAFLLIGYFRPVMILIGLVALGAGILNLREFIKTKGAIVCEVESEESKKKTIHRMERVVFSPLTLATIAGIIALAFVVNSIEFVCSSALPAIFTYILSSSNLATLQFYGYILVYVLFFMLDDLIIFGSAAFALSSNLANRYAKYCQPLGGTILFILGVLLLFAPNLLR